MGIVKLRTIEILTNGSLSFSCSSNTLKLQQLKINKKDYNKLVVSQKYQTGSTKNFLNSNYKYKFLKN